jgi:methylenetetrahydrofolate reductase (NADPH)
MSNRINDLTAEQRTAIARTLGSPRFELIPMKNALEEAGHLPPGATVTVTASPAKGMTATIDLAVELRRRGLDVVPHLSARLTKDRAELATMLRRLDDAGITTAFVIGGDPEERGEFRDGLALLEAMKHIGHGFTEIGVAGYPEGHPLIDDATLRRDLREKSAFASTVTTQMCFSTQAIEDWVAGVRAAGLDVDVMLGIPGVAELRKLIELSLRIGVGDSRRFLAKNRRVAGRLIRPGTYGPDRLILDLAPLLANPSARVRSFHIYTFNRVATTEAWRREFLDKIA